MRHHQAIKATRPGPEIHAPAVEVDACPRCHRKSNVRLLPGKTRYCTGCDLEFTTERPATVTRGRPRKYIVTVKAELADVERVIELWNAGAPLGDIAEAVCMDPDDVAIILIDLARRGRIGQRDGGVFGIGGAEQCQNLVAQK